MRYEVSFQGSCEVEADSFEDAEAQVEDMLGDFANHYTVDAESELEEGSPSQADAALAARIAAGCALIDVQRERNEPPAIADAYREAYVSVRDGEPTLKAWVALDSLDDRTWERNIFHVVRLARSLTEHKAAFAGQARGPAYRVLAKLEPVLRAIDLSC